MDFANKNFFVYRFGFLSTVVKIAVESGDFSRLRQHLDYIENMTDEEINEKCKIK